MDARTRGQGLGPVTHPELGYEVLREQSGRLRLRFESKASRPFEQICDRAPYSLVHLTPSRSIRGLHERRLWRDTAITLLGGRRGRARAATGPSGLGRDLLEHDVRALLSHHEADSGLCPDGTRDFEAVKVME
jgi:hypothetical protein